MQACPSGEEGWQKLKSVIFNVVTESATSVGGVVPLMYYSEKRDQNTKHTHIYKI